MAHRKLEFRMPAEPGVVFDAFHYHHWKQRWDSLVAATQVAGDAECPSVGATSRNAGAGLLRALSMETRFVAYERPKLAAASMVGTSFPFRKWAASMRHVRLEAGGSMLVYTYTIEAGPRGLRWLVEPVVDRVFLRATRKRFERLRAYLALHAEEIAAWRRARDAEG